MIYVYFSWSNTRVLDASPGTFMGKSCSNLCFTCLMRRMLTCTIVAPHLLLVLIFWFMLLIHGRNRWICHGDDDWFDVALRRSCFSILGFAFFCQYQANECTILLGPPIFLGRPASYLLHLLQLLLAFSIFSRASISLLRVCSPFSCAPFSRARHGPPPPARGVAHLLPRTRLPKQNGKEEREM
jgi:hypothetical protein